MDGIQPTPDITGNNNDWTRRGAPGCTNLNRLKPPSRFRFRSLIAFPIVVCR